MQLREISKSTWQRRAREEWEKAKREGAGDGEAWTRATGGHLAEAWGPKSTIHLEPEVEVLRAAFERAKHARTKPPLPYRLLTEEVNALMSEEDYGVHKLGHTVANRFIIKQHVLKRARHKVVLHYIQMWVDSQADLARGGGCGEATGGSGEVTGGSGEAGAGSEEQHGGRGSGAMGGACSACTSSTTCVACAQFD